MEDNLLFKPDFDSLLEDFYHPNPYINQKASILMVKYWPNESLRKFLELLQNKDINIRRKSIQALSLFESKIFSPLIKLYLSHPGRIMEIGCLKVLIKVFANDDFFDLPEGLLELIEKASRDDSPEIILLLISLLRQMGSNGLDKLFNLSLDSNILRSKAAIMALGEINDPNVSIHFKKLLEDKSLDPLIRESINIVSRIS